MPRLFALIAGLFVSFLAAGAQTEAGGSPAHADQHACQSGMPDSETLEKALQSLSWEQFKTVVSAIPKLKADVDAYGPLGWQYVQANYRTYPWKKNIDRLQAPQKRRLADLIGEVRGSGRASN